MRSYAMTPSSSSSPHRLPQVFRETLNEIKYVLLNTSPFDKDSIVSRLIAREGEYLRQLLDLFVELETNSDVVYLNILSEIWRSIIMLNDSTIVHFVLTVSGF